MSETKRRRRVLRVGSKMRLDEYGVNATGKVTSIKRGADGAHVIFRTPSGYLHVTITDG